MKGFGTSESVLLEVICTRTTKELAAIKEAYERYDPTPRIAFRVD